MPLFHENLTHENLTHEDLTHEDLCDRAGREHVERAESFANSS